MASKSRKGFASMDPEQQRRISRLGGLTSHRLGKAHTFTPEEARLGGLTSHRLGKAHTFTPEEAREAGKKGHARARRQ
jgi:general stress protein YciG